MLRTRRYPQDPYWTTARFRSLCSCGRQIQKGERIFYYPRERKAVCEGCGQQGSAALRAERAYEHYGVDCALDY